MLALTLAETYDLAVEPNHSTLGFSVPIAAGMTRVIGVTAVDWVGEGPIVRLASATAVDRDEFGVGTDWRHSLIPSFLGDEIAVEIFLWTKRGKPAEPENVRKEP